MYLISVGNLEPDSPFPWAMVARRELLLRGSMERLTVSILRSDLSNLTNWQQKTAAHFQAENRVLS
jgi:hypothetical protein